MKPYKTRHRIAFYFLTASFLELGFIHFLIEFGLIYKHGAQSNFFDFATLSPASVLYVGLILVLWFGAVFGVMYVDTKDLSSARTKEIVDVGNRHFMDRIEEFQDWMNDEHSAVRRRKAGPDELRAAQKWKAQSGSSSSTRSSVAAAAAAAAAAAGGWKSSEVAKDAKQKLKKNEKTR